ncbi:MAG: DNA polymerase III subunit alpha [bacterium]|nr:DNA polymerase III subunit alpha [bacterium]
MKYIPLRIYSVFSRGKGAVDPAVLADFLKQRQVSAVAVSDPFSMAGWERFRKEAVSRGMKPLPGMEIRVRGVGALVLYPITARGYFSLVSSFNRKVFTKMEDVMVIYIPHRGNPGRAPSFMNIRKHIPPENFYLGLEWNSSRWVVDLSKKYNIPLVWAQPMKWIMNPEKYAVVSAVFNHHPVSDILMGAKSGELPLYGPMSSQAITRRWGDAGRAAMKNTFTLASRIGFDFSDISAGVDAPQLLPASMFGTRTVSGSYSFDPANRLEETVNREMAKRDLSTAERERALRELNIITEQGFSVYFLIAAEIGYYCKQKNIYFNLRGSGVSSFILYLLGLSRVNPIEYDLLFERFVNSLRDDLPDIDIDIDSSRRPQVLKWVFEKYDKKVVFVSTHKFFKARSALYETARAYGFNAEDSHKMSKELAMFASPAVLKEKGRGKLTELYHMASLLDGVYKEYSLHLGGVLFSADEVKKTFPIETSPHGFEQAIWDKDTVERLRIFKLDLLGVRGFDVIAPVAIRGGVDFNDAGVWENIRKGRTIGCFQQESPLVRETLQKVRPRDLNELAVTIAIIRPGPSQSGMKQSYIEGKPALHPVLGKIFPRTRGNLIFEEQISVLLHTVTGWNLERSEKIRRDLKKDRGEQYKDEFFHKGRGNGWKETDLNTFWQLAENFSRYAFNQGHSVSYAYSAYLSAWFKTRHPLTFFCRLFNAGGGYYPLPFYIEEAKRWGIPILPPDINFSAIGFKEEKGAIRTGFIFIKGIGMTLASKVVNSRGIGYTGLEDFINRTGIGERDLASLMAVSAFGSLGHDGFNPREKEKNWKTYLGFVP